MEEFLISQQFTERNGFDPGHVAYGGWGFGGKHGPGKTGHMDLAHVRRVLEALTMQPSERNLSDVKRKAEVFLKMVQKHPSDQRQQPLPVAFEQTKPENPNSGFDGGFYFSPVVLRANKGRLNRTESPFWNSYATATCDGLLALLATDVSHQDERVKKAIHWLKANHRLDYPTGIPEHYEGENWRDAVLYYHLSVQGEVARAVGGKSDLTGRIASFLDEQQNPDGSFVNPNGLMKEDDPILCTALAILSLGKPDST